MPFAARLVRDLKASAPKTAALAVLTSVGLYFWIPPLWRAVAGEAAAAPAVAAVAAAATPAPSVTPSPPGPTALGWREAERLRDSDDLFRPAGRADVRSDAFTFDDDFLPLDVEFAEDLPETAVAANERTGRKGRAAAAAVQQAPAPPPLKLGSTLVGPARRAAIINDKVYAEGATIAVAGRTWTLRNVEPRRVVLDGNGGAVELRIAPFAKAQGGR